MRFKIKFSDGTGIIIKAGSELEAVRVAKEMNDNYGVHDWYVIGDGKFTAFNRGSAEYYAYNNSNKPYLKLIVERYSGREPYEYTVWHYESGYERTKLEHGEGDEEVIRTVIRKHDFRFHRMRKWGD